MTQKELQYAPHRYLYFLRKQTNPHLALQPHRRGVHPQHPKAGPEEGIRPAHGLSEPGGLYIPCGPFAICKNGLYGMGFCDRIKVKSWVQGSLPASYE